MSNTNEQRFDKYRQRVSELEAQLTESEMELRETQRLLHAQGEYALALQLLIETHARGEYIEDAQVEGSPRCAHLLRGVYQDTSTAIHTLGVPGYGVVGGIWVQLMNMAERTKAKIAALQSGINNELEDIRLTAEGDKRQIASLIRAAAALCAFTASHEYPLFPSPEYSELTALIDRLDTEVRQQAAHKENRMEVENG